MLPHKVYLFVYIFIFLKRSFVLLSTHCKDWSKACGSTCSYIFI